MRLRKKFVLYYRKLSAQKSFLMCPSIPSRDKRTSKSYVTVIVVIVINVVVVVVVVVDVVVVDVVVVVIVVVVVG